MDRSNDQIITNEPFKVRFGEKDFLLKRLPIAKSKAWRKQVLEQDMNLGDLLGGDEGEHQAKRISERSIDLIIQLLLSFADGVLTKDDIEQGTDEQVVGAYEKCLEVAFPLGLMDVGTKMLLQKLRGT